MWHLRSLLRAHEGHTLEFQTSPVFADVTRGTLMIYEALATYIRGGHPIRVRALRIRDPRQPPGWRAKGWIHQGACIRQKLGDTKTNSSRGIVLAREIARSEISRLSWSKTILEQRNFHIVSRSQSDGNQSARESNPDWNDPCKNKSRRRESGALR